MDNVSLIQFARAIDAEYGGIDGIINGSVSIDTRTLVKGQIFVAIKGNQVDGHRFINDAFDAGAMACIAEQKLSGHTNVLVVKNSLQALLQTGRFCRNQFSGLVAGVTGSCGKTSVKEMLASVFRQSGKTLFTQGNYNNAIGVPVTMSHLDSTYQYAVVEMGTNAPGEIGLLAQMVRPHIAIITNAEAVHIEKLKSVEGVAVEKGSIIQSLSSEGTAILNQDSRFYPYWCQLAKQQQAYVLSFSLQDKTADVYATDIADTPEGIRFNLQFSGRKYPVSLAFYGRHQVSNACAVAASALAAGLSPESIIEGLQEARPFQCRGQQFKGINNSTIIDESYNANPAAVQAAMDMLSSRSGKRIFVLGDMHELGDQTVSAHKKTGQYALDCGIDRLMTYGNSSHHAADVFGANATHFNDKNILIQQLHADLSEDTTVLVKGSRIMQMNEVVNACLESQTKKQDVEIQRST